MRPNRLLSALWLLSAVIFLSWCYQIVAAPGACDQKCRMRNIYLVVSNGKCAWMEPKDCRRCNVGANGACLPVMGENPTATNCPLSAGVMIFYDCPNCTDNCNNN